VADALDKKNRLNLTDASDIFTADKLGGVAEQRLYGKCQLRKDSNMKLWNYPKNAVLAGLVVTLVLAFGGCTTYKAVNLGYGISRGSLLAAGDTEQILLQAEATAKEELSLLRVDSKGAPQTTHMHIIVVDREGQIVGRRSMPDAWAGSVSIAYAKAFTAMAFSSDQNALTTRSVGVLSQPGGALWQIGNSNRDHGIIEFPGGLPLYREGKLVGGIGVSGDGVEEDENVAEGGAKGFEPPAAIRIDKVTNGAVPYTK